MFVNHGFVRSSLVSLSIALAGSSCAEGTQTEEDVGCRTQVDGPCDIFDKTCRTRLAALAACLWGDADSPHLPKVRTITREQFEADFVADAEERDPEQERTARGWQWALHALGVTGEDSLEPSEQASASRVVAYYRDDKKDITLIEGSTGEPASLEANQILVHELIHALQDVDFDLEHALQDAGGTFDAQLALRSLVEGEATVHEWRAQVVLLGDEVGAVDFSTGFRRYRDAAEEWLFEEGDPLRDSWGVVPYAFGGYWAFGEWGRQGLADQWANLPTSALPVLTRNWSLDAGRANTDWTTTEVQDGVELASADVLGAWGVYIALRSEIGAPSDVPLATARETAVAWRGDLLELVALENEEWALSWRIDFATTVAASTFTERMNELEIDVVRDGKHVAILSEQTPDSAHSWRQAAAD